MNRYLSHACLQVGYRIRDEVALFLIHAEEVREHFVDTDGSLVSPLDLALHMKVLPRITGGGSALRRVLAGLISWCVGQSAFPGDSDAAAKAVADDWRRERRSSFAGFPGQPPSLYPRTLARLCLMWERLESEGFTSYWL